MPKLASVTVIDYRDIHKTLEHLIDLPAGAAFTLPNDTSLIVYRKVSKAAPVQILCLIEGTDESTYVKINTLVQPVEIEIRVKGKWKG